MCICLEPTETIFPDTITQTNSRKQKKLCTHLLCICVSVYELKKSQKTLGQRNTDFLGYYTLDALIHENLIGLRPDLSSTC